MLESARAFLQGVNLDNLLEDASQQTLQALERCLFFEEIRNELVATQERGALFVKFGRGHPQFFLDTLLKMDDNIASKLQVNDLIAEAIVNEDRSLSSLATKLALKGDMQAFTTEIFPKLREQKPQASDEVRFRILQVGLDAGKKGAHVEEAYGWVLQEFFTEDLLIKLNSIELLGQLGTFPQGLEFIHNQGVTKKLVAELDNCFDLSLEVTIVRLLILLGRQDESMLPILKPRLLAYQEGEQVHRLTFLFAFGHLISAGWEECTQWPWTANAKKELNAVNEEIAKGAMAAWISAIPTLAKLRPELLEEVLPNVLKTIPKPFAELRAFAWQFLETLIKTGLRPMQTKILSSQEIRDNLLDFSQEMSYEPKIAKHGFVQALAQLPWIGDFLTPELQQVLGSYARGGPFYTPLQAKLETEREAN